MMLTAAVVFAPTRSSGGEPASSRSSDSAAASRSRIDSACSTSRQPAGVRLTLLGPRSTSAHACLPLELRHLLGDGGRREAKRLRRARDRPAQGDLPEDAKSADIEHKHSLTKGVAT